MQLVATIFRRFLAHSQVGILSGLLQIEQSSKHHRIPFDGHAAVVVNSGVERNAIRQQPLFSVLRTHALFIQRKEGPDNRPLS